MRCYNCREQLHPPLLLSRLVYFRSGRTRFRSGQHLFKNSRVKAKRERARETKHVRVETEKHLERIDIQSRARNISLLLLRPVSQQLSLCVRQNTIQKTIKESSRGSKYHKHYLRTVYSDFYCDKHVAEFRRSLPYSLSNHTKFIFTSWRALQVRSILLNVTQNCTTDTRVRQHGVLFKIRWHLQTCTADTKSFSENCLLHQTGICTQA